MYSCLLVSTRRQSSLLSTNSAPRPTRQIDLTRVYKVDANTSVSPGHPQCLAFVSLSTRPAATAMKSILSLALTAVALTSATPLLKRTVAQVETDINDIGTAVTNLENAINAFPNSGGSLVAALVRLIHHSLYMGVSYYSCAGAPQRCTCFRGSTHERY
jgi:hypothetical protein